MTFPSEARIDPFTTCAWSAAWVVAETRPFTAELGAERKAAVDANGGASADTGGRLNAVCSLHGDQRRDYDDAGIEPAETEPGHDIG